MNKNTIIIAIYANVAHYPPTINAIFKLSCLFRNVIVIQRKIGDASVTFPGNVKLISPISVKSVEDAKNVSLLLKFMDYVKYFLRLRKLIKRYGPEVILVYDLIPMALLKYINPPASAKLWYHNHDVAHFSEIPKRSFQRLFKKWELDNFKRINIFTLPTETRLEFFPVKQRNLDIHVLPNYPSFHFFAKTYSKKSIHEDDQIKIIHQGAFLPYNFKQLIHTFYEIQCHSPLLLSLAGPAVESVQQELYAMQKEKRNQIKPLGNIAYEKLPEITNAHHIGMALYGNHNIMVRTVATASNKVFEYISLGLPVIFTDREDFRELFEKYTWAHFVKSDYQNLAEVIQSILKDYEEKSVSARQTFETERNFELAWDLFFNQIKL